MKILLLTCNQPNQIALANRIAEKYDLAGIVIEQRPEAGISGISVKDLWNKILDRTLFIILRNTWYGLLKYYSTIYPAFPPTQTLKVANINASETVDFIRALSPDLIMVSGTRLIKSPLIDLQVPRGMINLHTGLSPYIKGGPNCTNWCIATSQFHLIGNTVMWINPGIDSGDIIGSEFTELDGNENLLQLHIKVMDHAHDLYIRSIAKIKGSPVHESRVRQQDISKGIIYYTRMWTFIPKLLFLRNVFFKKNKKYFLSGKASSDRAHIKTVPVK